MKLINKTSLFTLFLLVTTFCWAQTDEEDVIVPNNNAKTKYDCNFCKESELLTYTPAFDSPPTYKGSYEKLYEFIHLNLNRDSIKDTLGRVYIEFVVDKEGNVGKTCLRKGLSKPINNECLRVVKLIKFIPATQNKKPISAFFSLPISFGASKNPYPVNNKKRKR